MATFNVTLKASFNLPNNSKEWFFVLIINGNIKPCEVEVIQSVSSFTMFEHIPKGIVSAVENTENIITTSASHNKITA
jgi:hypothetical protein